MVKTFRPEFISEHDQYATYQAGMVEPDSPNDAPPHYVLASDYAALEAEYAHVSDMKNRTLANYEKQYIALEARCREQQDELTLLKRDRNSLIEMTGLTIVEVAKRLNRLRSSKETTVEHLCCCGHEEESHTRKGCLIINCPCREFEAR